MADYVYAAQIAQQGMRDLGNGLRQLGSDQADKAMADTYSKNNPDAQGQFRAEALRRHKATPIDVVNMETRQDSQDGQSMYWSLVKKAMDPSISPEQKQYFMGAANVVAQALGDFANKRKGGQGGGGGGGGGGGSSGSGGDYVPTKGSKSDPYGLLMGLPAKGGSPDKRMIIVQTADQLTKMIKNGEISQDQGIQHMIQLNQTLVTSGTTSTQDMVTKDTAKGPSAFPSLNDLRKKKDSQDGNMGF